MRTRIRGVAFAAVALVVLAGCLGGASGTSGFGPVWHSDTPKRPGGSHHPAAAARIGGQAYVASGFGDVGPNRTCSFTMLNGSGGVRWNQSITRDACGTQPASDPTFGDVTGNGKPDVVWATHEGRLYAANATTGRLAMNVSLPSGMTFAAPVVVHDPALVVLPMMNGHVRAYYPNGTTAWARSFAHHVRGQEPAVVRAANGTRELVVGTDGGLIALDPTTGATVWRNDAPTRFLRTGTVAGRPVMVGSGEDAGGNGSHVAAYAANGTVLWRHHLAGTVAVGAVGRPRAGSRPTAYATTDRGRLLAYDAATGRERWNRTLEDHVRYVPPPTLADLNGNGNPSLVATTAYGPVRVFDAATGTERASWGWSGSSGLPSWLPFVGSKKRTGVAVWAGLRSADLNGDGREEVVAVNTNARVVVLANRTG